MLAAQHNGSSRTADADGGKRPFSNVVGGIPSCHSGHSADGMDLISNFLHLRADGDIHNVAAVDSTSPLV
ncbi:hypothetical protein ACSSV4_004133 [Roseovarius sp. MBR-154]|jgi:hypothetical protein